ncbi:MAG: hypothetical protein MUF50_00585 [Planctomycetes bacterium]|jgi:hypothetical protein|nr:hypothetical protein [Planctomycetota bacterium]
MKTKNKTLKKFGFFPVFYRGEKFYLILKSIQNPTTEDWYNNPMKIKGPEGQIITINNLNEVAFNTEKINKAIFWHNFWVVMGQEINKLFQFKWFKKLFKVRPNAKIISLSNYHPSVSNSSLSRSI